MAIDEVRFEALGSSCHLLGVGLERGRLTWGTAWVAEMQDRFSPFQPESELSRLNAATGAWAEISPELEAMLRVALDAYTVSDGLVHVGVLGSMLAIGYTRPLQLGPTAAALADAVPPAPLPELLRVEP